MGRIFEVRKATMFARWDKTEKVIVAQCLFKNFGQLQHASRERVWKTTDTTALRILSGPLLKPCGTRPNGDKGQQSKPPVLDNFNLPGERIELSHPCEYWILSPTRLPVPPSRPCFSRLLGPKRSNFFKGDSRNASSITVKVLDGSINVCFAFQCLTKNFSWN